MHTHTSVIIWQCTQISAAIKVDYQPQNFHAFKPNLNDLIQTESWLLLRDISEFRTDITSIS